MWCHCVVYCALDEIWLFTIIKNSTQLKQLFFQHNIQSVTSVEKFSLNSNACEYNVNCLKWLIQIIYGSVGAIPNFIYVEFKEKK